MKQLRKKKKKKYFFENKSKELLDKNEKLAEKFSGQLLVQGARHLIWDMIITKVAKMRHYLNYIKDKEMVINVARQICTTLKETLDRKPTYTTQNTTNFLNNLSKEKFKKMGIKDRIVVITWARKVIGKHHHIESVQEKVDQILQQVKSFKGLFI